jgi:site-specific DNA-methyltransferase (cytosine-N4-specific)
MSLPISDSVLNEVASAQVMPCNFDVEALKTVDWNFAAAKTGHLTHSIHPYPAKFIPQIPHALIGALSKPGDTVGDIFCGSGTTLAEALSMGRHAVGVDANPLACLISSAKTAKLSAADQEELNGLVAKARSLSAEIARHDKTIPFVSKKWRPDFARLDFWFYGHVIEELAEIRNWCDGLSSKESREVALTSMSAIVVAVSKQDSDTRYVRREKNIAPGDTFKRFARTLEQNTADSLAFSTCMAPGVKHTIVNANLLDAPDIPLIDLMVCSPPYPNAYSYHLYHMTRMLWLGMDQPKFKKEEIGSHRKYSSKSKNAATVDTFKTEFKSILAWLSKHLRVGGYACFIVGDSTLRGQRIENAQLIKEVGETTGFIETARLSRTMLSSKKSFNPAIGKIKTEDILILRNTWEGQ